MLETFFFLLEKSNYFNSLKAFYLPAGGGNYVVNSEMCPITTAPLPSEEDVKYGWQNRHPETPKGKK